MALIRSRPGSRDRAEPAFEGTDTVERVRAVPRISYARSADGVSLAFTVAGSGLPVVFVPWVPFSNMRMEWELPALRRVFEQFARRLTVVHYDGRGTGHSQRDVADLSLDAMVGDLEAVVDELGLPVVSLIGQYNSCPHAIAYAARHPERTGRMVLFGGSARGWNAMSARQTQALLGLIEQDWEMFADTAAHQWMGWSVGEAGRAMAAAIKDAVTPQVARATMQAASAADVTDLLPAVTAPTLVLHRIGMSQIPVTVPRELAADLPRGRLVLLDGEQPTLFMDEGGTVATMILEFLCDGVEPSAALTPAGALAANRPPAPSPGGLTPRETEVLRLLAGGESNAQIARRLGLSTHTIERHVANLYRKIGARGRADATAYAVRSGLA
jgi:DNA-binding CsgD family transcriptional regulator/pimeloyl-ACP methyl ester carboxylesterase